MNLVLFLLLDFFSFNFKFHFPNFPNEQIPVVLMREENLVFIESCKIERVLGHGRGKHSGYSKMGRQRFPLSGPLFPGSIDPQR